MHDATETRGCEDREQLAAFRAWVDKVGKRRVNTIEDLCDGAALFELLSAAAPEHFHTPKRVSLDALHRTCVRYYRDELGSEVPPINAKAASRKASYSAPDLAQLLRLVLGVIVKSEQSDAQIKAMQELEYAHQMILKQTIESVLAWLDTSSPAGENVPHDPDALAAVRRALAKSNEKVSRTQDQLTSAEALVQQLDSEKQEARECGQLRAQLDIYQRDAVQEPALEKEQTHREPLQRQLAALQEENTRLAATAENMHITPRADDFLLRDLEEQVERHAQENEAWEQRYTALDREHKSRKVQLDSIAQQMQKLDVNDETSLDAVLAEITAMRNNAKSKEKEAQTLLRRLGKKLGANASKPPKELKPILDLLAESFQLEDVVIQRVHDCWSEANKRHAQSTAPSMQPDARVEALQRERDALKQEQRLIAVYTEIGAGTK
ncbi:hypothetical protein MVES_002577 [Malassezia vespertilionis]|uniref:HOOK N-terminal domain-containing protein n=1 Tax=Malassezia vespertilionis TaxID=2020962 RepID=A0A2N1JB45_9BASI|nr:hypothetical protein MVES_002577 [Malassezia vespertilionis]